MPPNPFLGVLLHAVGGLAAGSFYLPFKRVRGWAWETYWLVGGLLIWIICPTIAAVCTIPDLAGVYRGATWAELGWPLLFGIGWGIGHLTFGLSLRYLGMSLGMGLALGFCTFFGALAPPVFKGDLAALFATSSGRLTLAGLGSCLFGILFCSWAGVSKERELPGNVKRETIAEFHFARGVWVAFFAGVMSACFAFGVEAGDSLQQRAVQSGAGELYGNNAVLWLVLVGGGIANIVGCVGLNIRNRSGRDYVDRAVPLLANYLFCAMAGLTAYAEFLFFGMGESQMGAYSVFASWPIHMAFIILFSNLWGLVLREWRGTSARTRLLLAVGLLALVGSSLLSAYGTSQQGIESSAADVAAIRE